MTEFTAGHSALTGMYAPGIAPTDEPEQDSVLSDVEQALMNAMPTNVFVADLSLNIVFANTTAEATLYGLAGEIRESFGVHIEDIIDGSIHRFHKDPRRVERILRQPGALPHTAEFTFGSTTLSAKVDALRDVRGDAKGYIVCWEDVSEKKRLADEAFRIRQMVDNAPTAMMLVDKELTVTYLNEASKRTLSELERHLPVRVDQMVGTSIDVFHKNPSHQRRMLADATHLPHEAQIKLGEELLRLRIDPIFDQEGHYMAPMLTWEVVTDREFTLRSLEETASSLLRSSEGLAAIAEDVYSDAQYTNEQSARASQSIEHVSQNIQTVAAATQEMGASVVEISRGAADSASVASKAVRDAHQTQELMKRLNESSKEIGQVVKVITSIAQQTNLLALNATIEAARAGEAGKGFAVVANEVKELAKETARATEDISKRIEVIQEDTTAVVTAIEEIGSVITEINDRQMSIASAVDEQSASTDEIARSAQVAASGSQEVTHSVGTVSEATQKTLERVEQVRLSSQELEHIATSLHELIERVVHKK
ncbi:MAG: methyl-accepting chemotaxis protein [Myxococcota bacterium]